jgi:hypothetical protein
MQWIKLSAAMMILSAATQANAGLFDCCKKDPVCCAPAPLCCDVQPTCFAPAPMHCHAAPSCCAPAATCCDAHPVSHYAPVYDACSCGPACNCCPPKKQCCLHRLWDCEKRKNKWIMNRMGW